MRIASYSRDGREGYGVVSGDVLHPVRSGVRVEYPTLRAALATGVLADLPARCDEMPIPLASLRLLPPVPAPSKILCVGLNYKKPYPVAGAAAQSSDIVIFGRHDETLVGHGASLEMPAGRAGESYDYEGEIAAVIGRECRHVTPDVAMDFIVGYACLNEGSVRGWQKHSVHAGKNFFASGAWGPWLTTKDEAGPVEDMALVTRVNGKLMQEATGADMIHPLPELIAYLSNIIRLNPGDVIATGSPDGTGGSRTPSEFLTPDDVVEVEIPTVGTLRNRVASQAAQ